MDAVEYLDLLLKSLLLAGVYSAMAVGMTVIYGVMKIVNLAHAGFLMLGAYFALELFQRFHVDPILGSVLALPVFFLFGMAVHWLLVRWLRSMPEEWGYVEENRTEPVRGAALPMGFNRTPHYHKGLLLAGDAAGMVNPFNGEGIAYAMESGEIAARVITQALAQPDPRGAESVLASYPQLLKDAYGGYYTLGRKFVEAIGNPRLMQFATRHGMPRPALMRVVMKLLANLTEPQGGDAADRVINALSRMTPAA